MLAFIYFVQYAVVMDVQLWERRGQVKRVVDDYTVLVTGLFRKETDLERFMGLRVQLEVFLVLCRAFSVFEPREQGGNNVSGIIHSAFGSTGAVRIVCRDAHGIKSLKKEQKPGAVLQCRKWVNLR